MEDFDQYWTLHVVDKVVVAAIPPPQLPPQPEYPTCYRLINFGVNAVSWFPWGLVILCVFLLTGCGSYWCDKNLDANVASGNAMAYTIWHECNERNAARADAFQGGMGGVSRSFSEKSHIYSDQLPRNYYIHY